MGTGARSPEHTNRDPIFVGRADELERMTRLLARAADRSPATLLVRGEVGVGKSRLLAEFTRRARESGAHVMSGSCIALGTGEIPYAPLVEGLRQLVRHLGVERVRELAGGGYPVLANLISDFTDVVTDESETPATGLARQSRVFGAVLRLLDELGSDDPVVLIIEDLQWADRSTLDLLVYLARALSSERLLLIASYRTTDLAPAHPLRTLVAELELARRIEPLDVLRFGRADLKLFLRARLATEAGHDLVERAFELSDGNAFFVEELIAAGVLTADDGTVWLPQSVHDLVLSQFMRLGEDAREVMRVAATAGRRVSHRLLAAVCDMSVPRMLSALRECVDRQMLVTDPADDTYLFRHALLREVVHRDLLPGLRKPLHEAIAVALAADSQLSYADRLTVAAELSYHWYEAGAYPQALVAAVQAADNAMRLLAFRDAGRQYARALAIWPRLDDAREVAGVSRAQLLSAAADAARWAGRIDQAVELAGEAVSEVDLVREPGLEGQLYERLGSYLWEAGDHSASERAYADAELLLRDAPPSAATARVLAVKASKLVREGHHADGLAIGRSALEMARSVGAEPEEGRALNWIGVALAMRGEVDEGVRALGEAVHLADATHQLEDLIRGYGNLAYVLENAGRLDESVAVALKGLDRVRQSGVDHTRGAAVLANNMCEALVQLGRWDEAAAVINELLVDRPVAESLYPRLTLAEILVGRGQFEAADRLLTDVRAARGSERQPQFLGSLYACEAEVAIWQRQYEPARAAVAEGLHATRATEHVITLLRLCALGLRNEADEWLRRSRLPRTARPDLDTVRSRMDDLMDEVERILDAARDPVLPEVGALRLLCRAERGRADSADDATRWSEVARSWDEQARPYRAAYARWREAEQESRGGTSAARPAARRAHQLAESLGAGPLRDEILRLARAARLDLETTVADGTVGRDADAEPAPAEDPFRLTDRERQVLGLLCAGRTNSQIAAELYIARSTASVHVSNILTKLDVVNRGEAAAVASQLGLFTSPPAR